MGTSISLDLLFDLIFTLEDNMDNDYTLCKNKDTIIFIQNFIPPILYFILLIQIKFDVFISNRTQIFKFSLNLLA